MVVLSKSKGMVIAKVEGGLGNQLFIYGAAKRLAIRNHVSLKLDIVSGYKDDVYGRSYGLDRFNIDAEVATVGESYASAGGKRKRYVARKINKVVPWRLRYYIEEETVGLRLLDLRVSGKVYLQGYWQDERYFKDIESILRRELTLIESPDEENRVWAEKIAGTQAICLHARRKDYEHALSRTYYEKAIEYLVRKIEHPHFFCFSDDPKWIEKNLRFDFPFSILTHNNGAKAHYDLMLMARCRHFIVANSTFSWWGAWLNPSRDKIVVAPARWGYDTKIPQSWNPIDF